MFEFFNNYNKILALGKRLNGRSYSASDFTKQIRRQFPATDFVFKTVRDYAVDPDMMLVAGLYDCYNDAEMLPSIEVSICYHPEQDLFFADNTNWEQLAFDLAECIGHELVHREQYQRGIKNKPYVSLIEDSRKREDQEYLGDSGEIQSYGFSIAAESVVFKKPVDKCAMYIVYQDCFDNDPGIVLKLEKQIARYVKELEVNYEQIN